MVSSAGTSEGKGSAFCSRALQQAPDGADANAASGKATSKFFRFLAAPGAGNGNGSSRGFAVGEHTPLMVAGCNLLLCNLLTGSADASLVDK